MNLNQLKEVLSMFVVKTKDDDETINFGDSFSVDMPHKRRLYLLLSDGVFISGNRITFDKGIVTCISPEAKTCFSLESVVAVSDVPFLPKEKK